MAAIHVLDHTRGTTEYRVVVHWTVPAGNNSAGVAWKQALLNSGLGGMTVLKDGDGTAGTIQAAEKASLIAGDLMETVAVLPVGAVAGGAAGVNAYLDAQATRIIGEQQAELAAILRYFGGVR